MLDDVNSRVRRAVATLPPLAERLTEIDAVLQRPVVLVVDPGLAGQAGGKAACPEGVISLPPDSVNNLSVIGEEIMHLHRCTRGYPTIVPGLRSVCSVTGVVFRRSVGFSMSMRVSRFLRASAWTLAPRSEQAWVQRPPPSKPKSMKSRGRDSRRVGGSISPPRTCKQHSWRLRHPTEIVC